MKLKIKETGEILEDVKFIDTTLHKITIQYLDDGVLRNYPIKSLSDVEEVKDYEEPKEYWYIDCYGMVLRALYTGNEWDERRKLIGNYFETKEKAEKAAEKLKARTRLKNKGFRIALHGCKGNAWLEANWGNLQGDFSDVLLLFGGEE